MQSKLHKRKSMRMSLIAACLGLAMSGLVQAQTVTSPETGTVIGRAPTVATAIINGTPSGTNGTWKAGDVLTAVYTIQDPDLDPADVAATDLTIQWTSNGVAVGAPGSKTYALQASDAGKTVTYTLIPKTDAATTDPYLGVVTIAGDIGSDGSGGGTGGGGGEITPEAKDTLLSVEISGTAQVDGALNAVPTCIGACGAGITYQWQLETSAGSGTFSNIAGATGSSYTPVRTDQKRKVQVIATK